MSIETIQALNIQYWHVPVDIKGGWEKRIEELSKENNFKNQDTINVTEQGLGDAYADILKEFFDELSVDCNPNLSAAGLRR